MAPIRSCQSSRLRRCARLNNRSHLPILASATPQAAKMIDSARGVGNDRQRPFPSPHRGCTMKRWLTALLLLSLPMLATGAGAKPKAEKKPIETFTDADKAGPDFAIQGEYVGVGTGQQKVGVQVMADGDGQFRIKGHIGGLPGAGWSGRKEDVKEWKGKLENGKVTFGDKEGLLTIADGKITAMGAAFVLEKVTRKSPTEGLKPPEGAVVLFDGSSVDGWTKMDRKSPATWTLVDGGVMQVKGGDIL